MAHRYKIGTYDAEGSFFREFEHDDRLTPEALRALVFEALAEVAAADKARYDEMIADRRAEGERNSAMLRPWNDSLGQLAFGDDFRDALLARGFREAAYDGEVRLHGWSHALGGGACDDDANDDTRAAQAALRAVFGPAPPEEE